MPFRFRGGIHPDDKKAATRMKIIEELPAPKEVILPMSMHIGAMCSPIVSVGDYVKLGQRIAEATGPVSSPIHASVSGTVTAIEPRPHPNGTEVLSVVIENDFQDEVDDSLKPVDRFHSITADELADIVREAGIVGLGGAAFPMHIKIKSAVGQVDTLIINGAECEPYITADNRMIIEYAEELYDGVSIVAHALGLKSATIAIESNKSRAIEEMRRVLAKKTGVKLSVLHTKYPQGSEKQLIKAVTGREVPPGQLPSSVGVININTSSAIAISRALHEGKPLTTKVVTVSGSAVANPKNLLVRIGTPIRELFAACGDFKEAPYKVLMGGPMMGLSQHTLDVPVIKATNATLAFSEDEDKISESGTCIHCGKCVNVCPMHLMPLYIYRNSKHGRLSECEKLNVMDCVECGCCSYTCPARIHLVSTFRATKRRIVDSKKKGEQK